MFAYFIGGDQDLTKRAMQDNELKPIIRFAKSKSIYDYIGDPRPVTEMFEVETYEMLGRTMDGNAIFELVVDHK